MSSKIHNWRRVAHPLQLVTRKGWSWGRSSLISPRGTVFATRREYTGLFARRRPDWQLEREER